MKRDVMTAAAKQTLDAAVEFYKQHKPLHPEEVEILARSQPDLGAFMKVARKWKLIDR